jgi:Carboxypeptidase regulatory-like domain/TonB dependent receptor-like, beta-barrel
VKRFVLFLAMILVGAYAVLAGAQEDRGRISGLVTDPTGAVIPNASVIVTNEATGIRLNTVSTGEGLYVFPLLIPGTYSVDVDAAGFQHFHAAGFRVGVAGSVRADASLKVGSSAETVSVQASSVAELDTQQSVLGFTVEGRSSNDLPILYGNPFELQLLAPGVNSTTLSTGNHTYEGGSESASVDGSQSSRTEFTVDGAPDTRNGGGVTTAYMPSRDFVQEFKLVTSPYDASISHTSGASINSSIKSGTSEFHGSVSEFYQDPGVDAPAFSLGKSAAPSLAYHRESADLGGPIFRKKLFFFEGFEHQYNHQAASTSTQTIPTSDEIKGNFSALLAQGKTQTLTYKCPSTGQSITTAPFNTMQIYDAHSTRVDPSCPDLYVRDPVPGNILTSIDPVAAKILSYFPPPTGSASQNAIGQNNFVSNAANNDYYWDELTRIDYTIDERQRMFGHYLISKRLQPGKNLYFPGASGKTNLLKNKGAVVDYINTLSPTSLLDVRYSLTRFYTSSTIDAKTTATQLGVNANATAGAPAVGLGFPYVNISGFAVLGNADPSFEADTIHDGQVSYTKSLGRHQLKSGVEWRLYQANQADLTNEKLYIQAGGKYNLGPSSTASASQIGQALAGFEQGIAESTKETLNAQTANNTTYWAGYAQDDWRVNEKLVLNLGLRYEYFSPVSERWGKSITQFDTSVASPISSQAIANYAAKANATELSLVPAANFKVNGGFRFATPGQGLWNSQHTNLSPRVGFAYNPIPRLVVRGGFGIFYQHIGEYVQYGNPLGYTQTTNTIATNDNGVTFIASLANPFPNGLSQPTGNAAGLLTNVGTSVSKFFISNPKTPYSEHFSFGLQYALPSDILLQADYVGTLGRHLRITRDYNPVPVSVLSTDPTRTQAMTNLNTKLTANYPNPFQGISIPVSQSLFTSSTIAGTQLLKPYPQFSGVTGDGEVGMSNYNSLQVMAQKRFSHGYNMSISYTWSRLLDALSYLNTGDAKPWFGTSNTDYPQTLSVAAIYELPFGKGKPFLSTAPGWVQQLAGFQVEGMYRITSGQPLSFTDNGSVLKPGKTYADIHGPSKHTTAQWFNTDAFESARADNDGTLYANNYGLVSNLRTFPLRFNNVRQDYQNLLNVGAIKDFDVYSDRVKAELRAEAINAMNHPVYSNPNSSPSNSSFGVITGFGNQSRQLQFALTLTF